MPRHDAGSFRITTASRSRSDDIAARQRRYLISMGIRTVCFVLGVVFIGHWFGWAFIIASFVLPYIAVVMANAGSTLDDGGPEPFRPDPSRKSIEGPPRT
jgi:Protein of unknown function (DUF3099)